MNIKKIKHFIRYNKFFNFLIFKPYIAIWSIFDILRFKIRIFKYHKKYFGKYNFQWIKDHYKHEDGINIWFLLEQSHRNIGDLAIGVADQEYFEKLFPSYHKHYVYEYLYSKNKKIFEKLVQENDIIVLTGGGSIGNYESHEVAREDIISRFKNNIIISMPQTMCFPNDKKGRENYSKAIEIYKTNKNLILFAREKHSYDDMKKAFPENKIYLSPDIVMSLNKIEPVFQREGFLLCFRNDLEKNLTDKDVENIRNTCLKYNDSVSKTDMTAENEFVSLKDRENVVNEKINQFKHSQLVITDRLHCMIFCAISGTPCIALSNYNWKVKGCYDWLKNLNYIKYCENISDVESNIIELHNIEPSKYNSEFTEPYFSCIVDYINSKEKF